MYYCDRSNQPNSVVTNDHLNVLMEDGSTNPDVWAIGDAASIEDAPMPATAQGEFFDLDHISHLE